MYSFFMSLAGLALVAVLAGLAQPRLFKLKTRKGVLVWGLVAGGVFSQTGDNDSAAMSISKMSCNRYKRYLYLAAENAYKWDVDCAAFYHKRRERGHTHTQAVCAVANGKLLPRIHHLLKSPQQAEDNAEHRPRYVFRDLDGNPISKAEARAIIRAKWGQRKYSKKGLASA